MIQPPQYSQSNLPIRYTPLLELFAVLAMNVAVVYASDEYLRKLLSGITCTPLGYTPAPRDRLTKPNQIRAGVAAGSGGQGHAGAEPGPDAPVTVAGPKAYRDQTNIQLKPDKNLKRCCGARTPPTECRRCCSCRGVSASCYFPPRVPWHSISVCCRTRGRVVDGTNPPVPAPSCSSTMLSKSNCFSTAPPTTRKSSHNNSKPCQCLARARRTTRAGADTWGTRTGQATNSLGGCRRACQPAAASHLASRYQMNSHHEERQ